MPLFAVAKCSGVNAPMDTEGVRESSQPPAHAHNEFVVRVEEPLTDIRFGWVQSACEDTEARGSANRWSLLYTNCSGPRTICVRGRGPVSAQRVSSNVF